MMKIRLKIRLKIRWKQIQNFKQQDFYLFKFIRVFYSRYSRSNRKTVLNAVLTLHHKLFFHTCRTTFKIPICFPASREHVFLFIRIYTTTHSISIYISPCMLILYFIHILHHLRAHVLGHRSAALVARE